LTWLAAFAVAAVSVAPAEAQAQGPREIVLTVGKSLLVNSTAPIERVSVGFGEIADARVVDPREVLLNGKAPGETSLIIWQEGGNKLFFDVTVRANGSAVKAKLDALQHQFADQLPGQNINARFENDAVFLTGTAKDLTSVDRAIAMAAAVGKVVNLLYVEVPATDTQIVLKVQFASVDRSASTELGMNLLSTGATNTIGRVTTGQFSAPTITANPNTSPAITLSDALNFFLFRPDLNLGATIKALQTRGLFETLAEPNVLAINGKQASFLAGGEFPYPILQGGGGGIGTVTIAFREFGIRLNVLPVVTPRGTIRLDVAPEVSALDYSAGLTFQGFTIPGLTTRRVQTEIELDSGQSFAIGGLLDRSLNETLEKVPLLANVPLLGKLFQSKSLTKQNNELLVIVTPEIVHPVRPDQQTHLNIPVPLMGPDTIPGPAGLAVTGQAAAPAGPSIPVEKLMQSLKDQNSMKLQGKDLLNSPNMQPLDFQTLAQPPAAAPAAAPVKQ
jgi:pilus assembly protein CpaC